MLYEVWTARIRPGVRGEVFDRLGAVVAERQLPLFGAWYVEVGQLDQVIHVFAYEDLRHAAELRPRVDSWSNGASDLFFEEETELFRGVPFLDPLPPGGYGPVYEMRTYTFRAGTMPQVLDVWAAAVPSRIRLSPLVACWTSEVGRRNRLRHIWGYRSLDERARIRREALTHADWPPMTREWRVHEESEILLPAPYSPLT